MDLLGLPLEVFREIIAEAVCGEVLYEGAIGLRLVSSTYVVGRLSIANRV